MDYGRLSIVIPAFNEEQSVAQVVRDLQAALPQAEIVVVNDASTDNTHRAAVEAGATVLDQDIQGGYGFALKTGARFVEREYVAFCDADGQHRAEDLKRLVDESDGLDLVVGARTKDSHRPWLRRPGKFVLARWAEFLAGRKIPDLNSGMRVFKRETLLRYLHLMPDGFSFSTTSTLAFMKSKRRMKYLPITVEKRAGSSTVNQVTDGLRVIMLILRLTVLFEPLKVFLMVSGIFMLLSLLSLTIDIFGSRGLMYGGGVADTTVLFGVATVVIFMSGLLCDQISAIRRERHE